MCLECGCGRPGPTRIDGKPAEELASPLVEGSADAAGHAAAGETHSHVHTHADGTTHAHPHTHPAGLDHAHPQAHEHAHQEHPHAHPHPHPHAPHTLPVEQSILAANDRIAERNRGFFKALGLLALNVVSSPGSGKTTLIEKTVQALGDRLRTGVIVGDLATDHDAQRLRGAGTTAVQITTGTLCHLDASMVARALGQLEARQLDLLFVENVGNLVCPAAFDLGEDLRVVLWSVTEGEDKPLKYPPIFHSAQAVVVSKIDLAQAVGFDRETALANVQRVSPKARVFELSARVGTGMDAWCEFLLERHKALPAA